MIPPKSCANRILFWVAITLGMISPKNKSNNVTAKTFMINSIPGTGIWSNRNRSSMRILETRMIQILIKLLAINIEVNNFFGSSNRSTILLSGL